MLNRINFIAIINEHLKTFRSLNQRTTRMYWKDVVLFFIFPLIASIVLTYKKVDLTSQVTNMIAAVSILGGFLFNLLAIIYGAMDKLRIDAKKDELKKVFIKEIHTNISFNILLSILTILSLILYSYELPLYCLQQTLLFLNYFLLILFLLTLLMVLNRIYILLKKDAEDL